MDINDKRRIKGEYRAQFSQSIDQCSTFHEHFQRIAKQNPQKNLFIFLNENGVEIQKMSALELDRRAKSVAKFLKLKSVKPGDRVTILCNPGYDFIISFFGCMYAGAIAVPCFPPLNEKHFRKLFKIGRDCQTTALILSKDFYDIIKNDIKELEKEIGLGNLNWLNLDNVEFEENPDWTFPFCDKNTILFLQYTSGSTDDPKGVIVTHDNILQHTKLIYESWGYIEHDRLVTWLPPYHDMGLIGCILVPAACLLETIIMSPMTFIQKPLLWLKTITKYKAICSGGPNFAFQYCINKITDEEKKELDLSCLVILFTGAEPINYKTICDFEAKFEDCGLRKGTFYPCYGLAEATLLVAGNGRGKLPKALFIDRKTFSENKIVIKSRHDENTHVICSSGTTKDLQQILIVDKNGNVLKNYEIGEIWIENSRHTPLGYWKKEEITQKMFHAIPKINGIELKKRYFRTGDLGFVDDEGSLYVCGRKKDLIIIRGRNLYPQDLESVVENCSPSLRKGCCAAFSIEPTEEDLKNGDTVEKIVIVVEAKSVENSNEIFKSIRTEIALKFQVHVTTIVLIKPRTIPKTTSGKIRRFMCKKEYLLNKLEVLASSTVPETVDTPIQTQKKLRFNEIPNDEILNVITEKITNTLQVHINEVDIQKPFSELGLDSIKTSLLVAELSEILERPISPTLFFEFPNIEKLANFLSKLRSSSISIKEVSSNHHDDIAIIGIACRFPGANNVNEFWDVLRNGINAVTDDIPAERSMLFSSKFKTGFLKNVFNFDPDFFGISRREANSMDPQQRIMLHLCVEALEDAGIPFNPEVPSRTGVFIGASTSDFALLNFNDRKSRDIYSTTGSALSIIANRISYIFNFTGPSCVLDSACSSSLLAVHSACKSLKDGECDIALAGGVSIILSSIISEELANAKFLSPDGRCKTFDAEANGYVRGEGAGIVVLKPLRQALNDNDHIYAIIKGSATVQDGRSNGLTAPNPKAQEQVIKEALSNSGVTPDKVDYIGTLKYKTANLLIELHGTGTYLGDPIEAEALGRVFTNRNEPCLVGSVKTNIGHLEAAAGIAGLIKVALSLKHKEIPKMLHFEKPNPFIDFEKLKIKPTTELVKWPTKSDQIAGVSSFGFGGTNVHVVLEAHNNMGQHEKNGETCHQNEQFVLCLSSKTKRGLILLAEKYLSFVKKLETKDVKTLSSLCYTSLFRRTHYDHRCTIVYRSFEELEESLENFRINQSSSEFIKTGCIKKGKVIFCFPGQGTDTISNCKKLFNKNNIFTSTIKQIDAEFKKLDKELSIIEKISNAGDVDFDDLLSTQALIFATQIGLANMWMDLGVLPNGVIGHSMGEISAAVIAGAISLEAASRIIYYRSILLQKLFEKGRMIIARITESEAHDLIGMFDISIAVVNAPQSITFSGDTSNMERLHMWLTEKKISHKYLDIKFPFHSKFVENIEDEFFSKIGKIQPKKLKIPFYSSLLGKKLSHDEGYLLNEKYWMNNMKEKVMFSKATSLIGEDGGSILLELAGREVLIGSITQTYVMNNISNFSIIPSFTRNEKNIISSICALYSNGVKLDWMKVAPNLEKRVMQLPTYEWSYENFPLNIIIPQTSRELNFQDLKKINLESLINYKYYQLSVEEVERYQKVEVLLEDYCIYYILKCLYELGWKYKIDEEVTLQKLIKDLNIQSNYTKLLKRLLEIISTTNLVKEVKYEKYKILSELHIPKLEKNNYKEFEFEFLFLENIAKFLPRILIGEENILRLLFSDFQSTFKIYERSIFSKIYNLRINQFFKNLISNFGNKSFRVCEIGAGTGGVTTSLVKILSNYCTEYYFTDVSKLFLTNAKQKFIEKFMKFTYLDIEKDITKQGLPDHYFDIVIAANVIHATKSIKTSLTNIKKLLKPNGLVILLEVTKKIPFLDLTFGLTSGWWRFEDYDIRNYPLLSKDKWKNVFVECDFEQVFIVGDSEFDLQSIIVAKAPNFTPKNHNSLSIENRGTLSLDKQIPKIDKKQVDKILNLIRQKGEIKVLLMEIEIFITQIISSCLYLEISKINPTHTLKSLGMDSLLAMEIGNIIQKELNLKLPLAAFSDDITIKGLALQLVENITKNESLQTFSENNLMISNFSEVGDAPSILGMGIGTPDFCYTQKELSELAQNHYKLSNEMQEKLKNIFKNTQILKRYSVLDLYKIDPIKSFSTFEMRNKIYGEHVINLAFKSAMNAIKEWGGDLKRITHIVCVSTTGVRIPGVEFELALKLGLSQQVQRLAINFMGCFGALPGLKTASAFAKLSPKNRVLLVCTEICSAHVEDEPTVENFVSASIFGDGSAAVILGCPPFLENEKPIYEVQKSASFSVKDTMDKMYWNITSKGWRLGLSKDIPLLIHDYVYPFAKSLLGHLEISNVEWALHPGGKSILLAIENALKLKREWTQPSWDIMRDYGNMSSSTILFVLDLMKNLKKHENICVMVFGPGLVLEGALLKRKHI